jgi:hypothetical protein
MIRNQRRAHVRIWTVLAVVLPLAVAGILALAPGPAQEHAPKLLEPAAPAEGTAE